MLEILHVLALTTSREIDGIRMQKSLVTIQLPLPFGYTPTFWLRLQKTVSLLVGEMKAKKGQRR